MGWDVVYAIRVLAILIYLFKILKAGNKLLLDKNIHYVLFKLSTVESQVFYCQMITSLLRGDLLGM